MYPNVEVIKGNKIRKNRNNQLEQIRVAPYCRVSTDSEEQAKSYQSQVKYYEQLIQEKKEWTLVEIYTDEAVSGTRDDKRDGFLQMIQDCKHGLIDLVITKSISRFARNTVDTLRYVRLLKEMSIPVLFEEENINTMTMDGELLLTILSSVAQQEVENTSANVKKGLKMKMKRGELIGFHGALGYDYDPETKTITINNEEAKIVQYIFQRYLEGAGGSIIGRELEDLGVKTKRGSNKWGNSTVLGILKNEKYKGDLLQGKTFTVDPISKRRLENFGEEDKYYISNHHEPIISDEDYDEVQAIIAKKNQRKTIAIIGKREKYTSKYAFSSLCECGFCGSKLIRRSWNAGTPYAKSVWTCSTSVKTGKINCPHSKGIPESILEGAFLKSYNLLCSNKSGAIEEFIKRLDEAISDSEINDTIKKRQKQKQQIMQKRSKLTDAMLENALEDEDFKSRYASLTQQINELDQELEALMNQTADEADKKRRLNEFRKILENNHEITEYDKDVMKSTIEKVIVGEIDEEGDVNPYKITFIYRTGDSNQVSTSLNGPKTKSYSLDTDNTCGDRNPVATCGRLINS